MLDKKALRKFTADNPAPAIPPGHGLLHAPQVDLALRAALVKDGLLGVGQSFHAVVVMVVEEAAYPLIVRGGVEYAFPGSPLQAGADG